MLNEPVSSALLREATQWRRHFHANPELGFEEFETAKFVSDRLREFGVDEIEENIAGTGIVATIRGKRPSNRRIGIRADMDALPIREIGNVEYRSRTEGKMHACGHDGHTAILLATAKYLASTRDFEGDAVLFFQPAEESGLVGARRMIEAGVLERHPVDQMFALHNTPGLPVGTVAIGRGAVMAAYDFFTIVIHGKGAHASRPHMSVDPVVISSALVSALQTVVSRSVDPREMAVVSICTINSGTVNNVIPQEATIGGSIRCYSKAVQDIIERRISEIAIGIGMAFGAEIEVQYERSSPPVINHDSAVDFALKATKGKLNVIEDWPPAPGGEDFAFFLEAVPGAYIRIGNGDSEMLHHPAFDFCDEAIATGVALFVNLVEEKSAID